MYIKHYFRKNNNNNNIPSPKLQTKVKQSDTVKFNFFKKIGDSVQRNVSKNILSEFTVKYFPLMSRQSYVNSTVRRLIKIENASVIHNETAQSVSTKSDATI